MTVFSFARFLIVAVVILMTGTPTFAAEVVTLTQTPCQFLEPEGGDQHFTSTKKADCVAENLVSGTARLAEATTLTLVAGDYIFRVTNQTVPYALGFWLREADYDWKNPLHKLTKTSISGGGLSTGATKDYAVTLEPGEYVYSCPLNTTPDYKLVVTD
ncbi:MAG: hypothetical protein HN644_08000 [Rhodospirillales bacterium]|nr:hypothetical protein [Rhodospirillales bacterium]MBT4039102.1 hypothetical protein [Rhodospirillales bacterium]MBT4625503.1 hypothetical protein [Rhodospirillales bacterium]MBT5352141.1 hypothetical protein [Rhodospirillales bacterium]MBT5521910.1 hypothetical protein [Rhodospirillales bacterium]